MGRQLTISDLRPILWVTMDQCKLCACSGWFFALNKQGLCANCHQLTAMEISMRRENIEAASRRIEITHNPQSKLAALDIMAKNLEALEKLEEKGIPTIEGSPSAKLKEAHEQRLGLILETARGELKALLERVERAKGLDDRRKLFSQFLLILEEYAIKGIRTKEIVEIKTEVRRALRQVELNAILDDAHALELKGKSYEALNLYKEAASFLKKAELDETYRTTQIAKINGCIKALGGKPGGKEKAG